MTLVESFEVVLTRCICADDVLVEELPALEVDSVEMVALYRAMVLARTFDAKAIALQRTGRLGTFPSGLGQEAVGVGLAAAMAPRDVFLPSFREHGAQLVRGVTLEELFLFWGGDERGNVFAGPVEDFPVSVPVGSHVPHAVGVALAFKLRGQPRVAVAALGDGATSKGDFYEALNVAGVWGLPVVFVVANNQWAISVPRAAQTRAETLAQKAIAAGFDGLQVDGNDVVAVRQVVAEAIAKARAGGGPTLIEALTYRLGDHTTVDDVSRYRDDEEVGRHWKQEPVARLRAYLTAAHGWRKEDEEALLETCAAEVERAAQAYLATPPQPAASIFEHLFAELPPALEAQRDAVIGAAR